MNISGHARDRLSGRLTAADMATVTDRLAAIPAREGRHAVVLAKLATPHGPARGPSNGDLIVAICEREVVITVMYRRSRQPLTPEALGVESVDGYERLVPDPPEDLPPIAIDDEGCSDVCDDCGWVGDNHNPEVEH